MIWGILGAMQEEIEFIRGQMEQVRETEISGSIFLLWPVPGTRR